jgi:LuxR family transcriptional regulator, maltose regulon positive regulatory protein
MPNSLLRLKHSPLSRAASTRQAQRQTPMPKAATIASPKIARPRLHKVVVRERLFRKIAAAAPIVWISGPPGAGKTTLAASYLESRKLPAMWYQVDSGDADPATFFYYLGLAAAQGGFCKRGPLPLLPTESTVDLAAFTRRYFRELFERLPRSAVLVFDNFQDATGLSFETLLREALSQVPDGIAIIVLSLSDPPAVLARLVANRVIELLDPEELRLTPDESKQLVLSQLALDDTALAKLHDRSGGWAAGLVLLAEHARRVGPHNDSALGESQEAVFAYFAGEIFSRVAPETQRLLMLTAALPRVTLKLAEAISGNHGAGKLLDYLYRRHLFIDRRQVPEIVYQYHGLFRAFLLARAEESLPLTERAEVASRAGRLLEADGHAEDAVNMYLEAADWPTATRVILQHARHLYEQGRWRTLLDWIASLPSDILKATPWLGYWDGACQVWVHPPVARRQLEDAFDRFVALGDRTGQVLTAGAMSRACILDPDWTVLDKWIAVLETMLSNKSEALSAQSMLIGFSRLLYAALARQPQHPRLAEWAERVEAALSANVDCNEAVLAGFSLMMYYNSIGATSKQDDLVRQLHPLLANPHVGPVSLTYWKWAQSNYVLRVGQPREALALVDEGLELAESSGLAIAAVIRRYRIGHLLTLGDLTSAEAEIKKLESAPHIEPYFEMRSWLALQRGNFALAEREAQTAKTMAIERGRTYYQMLDVFLLAEVSAEEGAIEEGQTRVDEYRRRTIGMAGPLAEYLALLVEAYLALQQRDRPKCHARLRAALDIGSRQRYCSHWSWSPRMMVRLYEEALAHGIEVAYVRDVIRQHGMRPESPDTRNWPWPVRIYALGHFEVFNDGVLLRFEGKAQRKPIELAKILVALGGRDVSANALIDLLWPEPSSGDAQKAFEITVHRLRRLLGCDQALQVTARSVSLNPQLVWVDVWALERRLAPLIPAVNAALPEIELLESEAQEILNLYRGHFLAGEAQEPWQIALRNRLSGRFQRFVLRLGEHLEACELWPPATELYQRAVELDPLGETFYRRQMVCLLAQGQRAEAIEVFRRCRQTLSVTLGVPPAAETEAVYRQLLAL